MPVNTITDQSGFATLEPANLFVKRESYSDGTFGFSWRKFPFYLLLFNRECFSSIEENEAAIQRFVEQTSQREQYLMIVVQ